MYDALYEVAGRLTQSERAGDLTVEARRRRHGLVVTEGLWTGDKWTDVFEPVRRRGIFKRSWHELQSVPEAASKIGRFLDERPDLAD